MKSVLVISYNEDNPYLTEMSCPSGELNVETATKALASAQVGLLQHQDNLQHLSLANQPEKEVSNAQ